jgi:hypothetical protein
MDLLHRYNGRRSAGYGEFGGFAGMPLVSREDSQDTDEEDIVERDFELPLDQWQALSTSSRCPQIPGQTWQWMPRRFVDGKKVGLTGAWMETPDGYPVPIWVGQVGATAIRAVVSGEPPAIGELCLEAEMRPVERVVCFEAGLFPWVDVESFAAVLQASGYRLLIANRNPKKIIHPFDFEALQKMVNNRSQEEMFRLEQQAIRGKGKPYLPTVTDGRLADHQGAFPSNAPLYGVIKTHHNWNYLHDEGWRIFSRLQPFERTPAIAISSKNLKVITWYVRLNSNGLGGPHEGIIRVEVQRTFFVDQIGKETGFCAGGFVDRLSRILAHYQTRDSSYGRAAVTLLPIQRAEDSLGACFCPSERVVSEFYHMAQI